MIWTGNGHKVSKQCTVGTAAISVVGDTEWTLYCCVCRSVKENLLAILLTVESHRTLQSQSDSVSVVDSCVKLDRHTQTHPANSQGL